VTVTFWLERGLVLTSKSTTERGQTFIGASFTEEQTHEASSNVDPVRIEGKPAGVREPCGKLASPSSLVA
jgi:hypothetical protein